MRDDFTKQELFMISQIMKAEKTMPDEFWAVEAVQMLACVLAEIKPVINDMQATTLICVGALIARQGKLELSAEIQAIMAIEAARHDQ